MGRTITAKMTSTTNFTDSNLMRLYLSSNTSTAATMNSNEFPIKATAAGTMERVASINANSGIRLCSASNRNTYKTMGTIWLKCGADGGTTLTHSMSEWNTFTGSNLKGLALGIATTNNADQSRHSAWTVKIYTHYTIDPPTNVTVPSTSSGLMTLSWTAPVFNDGTLDYYKIQYSDRDNSSATWGSWVDLTTTISTQLEVAPNSNNNGQRRFSVQAIGTNTAYNSTTVISNICTTDAPNVSPGDKITLDQMNELRQYRLGQALSQ